MPIIRPAKSPARVVPRDRFNRQRLPNEDGSHEADAGRYLDRSLPREQIGRPDDHQLSSVTAGDLYALGLRRRDRYGDSQKI